MPFLLEQKQKKQLENKNKNLSLALAFLSFLIFTSGLSSCTTQRYLEKGKDWVPYSHKKEKPLQVEVEKTPYRTEPLNLKEFLSDCRKEPDGRLTKFYHCQFQHVNQLKNIVKRSKSKKGTFYLDSNTNTMVITDTARGMEKIGRALKSLDIPSPQVKIRVRVIELIKSRQWEHGVEYFQDRSKTGSSTLKNLQSIKSTLNPKNYLDSQKPGASDFQGTVLSFINEGKNRGMVDIVVRMFQEMGNATVDASPDVVVAQGKTAKIIAGEEVPFVTAQVRGDHIFYTTKFKSVGVSLKVRPELIDHESAKLYVNAEVSMVTGWTDPSRVGGVSNPMITKRATETSVQARDGEIFLFGGLMSRRKMLVRRSLPILGDIPVLGYLFSSTRYENTHSHLTFLLSVEVLSPVKDLKGES